MGKENEGNEGKERRKFCRVLTVRDSSVHRRRSQPRDNRLHGLRVNDDIPDPRHNLRRAVREEHIERNERREQPQREEREQRRLHAQEAAGGGDEREQREQREDAADDGDVVARVEHVVRVDAHGAARGRGALEVARRVVELGERVDADAHCDYAEGEEEDVREEPREAQGGVRVRVGCVCAAEHCCVWCVVRLQRRVEERGREKGREKERRDVRGRVSSPFYRTNGGQDMGSKRSRPTSAQLSTRLPVGMQCSQPANQSARLVFSLQPTRLVCAHTVLDVHITGR